MSDKKYTLPGMADWSFKVPQYSNPMLWHKGGAGFEVTTATSAQDIAEGNQSHSATNHANAG